MMFLVAGSRLLARSFNSAISALASALPGGGGTRKSRPDAITHVFQLTAFGSVGSAAYAAASTPSSAIAVVNNVLTSLDARTACSLLLDEASLCASCWRHIERTSRPTAAYVQQSGSVSSRKKFLFGHFCEPAAHCKRGGGRSVAAAGLVEDAGQVIGDGMVAERQFVGDLSVTEARSDETEHLCLAPRQPGRQPSRRCHSGLRRQAAKPVAGTMRFNRHPERVEAAQRSRQLPPRPHRAPPPAARQLQLGASRQQQCLLWPDAFARSLGFGGREMTIGRRPIAQRERDLA